MRDLTKVRFALVVKFGLNARAAVIPVVGSVLPLFALRGIPRPDPQPA
jgi:hypothetical protein